MEFDVCMCTAGEKSSWPEVVGMDGEAAKEVVESETRGTDIAVTVIIVQQGSAVTQDIRCDRVRIFVDSLGLVVAVPRIS